MASASVIGSTGLVGHEILLQLLAHPAVSAVTSLVRREPPKPAIAPKHSQTIEADSSTWPSTLTGLINKHSSTVLFSALGTTRAAAGGVEAQRKIDFDLNLDLAKAAKESGKVSTYVLISSANANKDSWNAYVKMKGELEEEVKKLSFEKTVIVRPGLILGQRESTRLGEEQAQWVARGLRRFLPTGWVEGFAQDAECIARASVRAGVEDAVWEGRKLERDGEAGKVWVMGQNEIVELGLKK